MHGAIMDGNALVTAYVLMAAVGVLVPLAVLTGIAVALGEWMSEPRRERFPARLIRSSWRTL